MFLGGLNYFLNKISIFAKTVLRRMHINHELPAFTTNGCKWVQDQPELYLQIPKVGWTGLDRAFYRLFSEKSTKKTLFLLQPTCIMHVYRPAIFSTYLWA